MENDLLKIEKLKLKIKNLIASRQLIVSALIVLIGGIVGLFLTLKGTIQKIFITFGIIYVVVLINDFITINKKINNLLK